MTEDEERMLLPTDSETLTDSFHQLTIDIGAPEVADFGKEPTKWIS